MSDILSVEQLFIKAEQCRWFSDLGKPCAEAASVVASWNEALAEPRWSEWGNFALDGRNLLTGQLSIGNPAAIEVWNGVNRAFRPRVDAIAAAALREVRYCPDVKKVFDALQWDLLTAAMETYFGEHLQTTFCRTVMEWHLRGRFVCGWEGDYSTGRPVVF